jgi:Tol biopolymer transport system component
MMSHEPAAIRLAAQVATLVLTIASRAIAATGWDIADTGQPYRDVEFTVTEGTWINVDVSPDGGTLLFDLLGDVYRLPAAGGEAVVVHGGPAMQRAASFSSDGRRILYLSDADGTDNLWVSAADGSNARQITRESVDMLNAPAWGPDGSSAAASKTVATFPKMYGSELRLFDLAGGAGRVLVEAPANGRDVQEAGFSPDGRYLFYTERITNPNIYVDANHENFVVKRRELASGDTEVIAGGFGGATAPKISHDGKQLAFVRRVKDKTVLFVYDFATRRQFPVFDGLDRDLMADFVPQGVYYPRYGWFPDNRTIAIWGKGRLQRVDTQSGIATEIPFRATVTHRITDAVRTGFELAPESFEVRTARHLAPAPDGAELVFTALGRLWRKQLPDGAPARLTTSTAFESDPARSRDGRQLAWAEWEDEKGGALRLMQANGRTRILFRSRSPVRQPAFSPDGTHIAFRVEEPSKTMGGQGERAGVYWIAMAGGEAHFVADGDDAPGFSADGSRIHFVTTTYANRGMTQQLRSADLDGRDAREHMRTPDADTSDLRLSPDGHWLAFREKQQYYVMPYRETGGLTTVSASTDAVPVAKLTELGGNSLAWSADSSRLYWTLGPAVYRVAPAEIVRGRAGLPQAFATLGLRASSDRPQGSVAFTNARVLTMRDEEVIPRATVVVTGNRIAAVGPPESVAVPAGAKVVDVGGRTLMPGFIDMHGHLDCCYGDGAMPQKQPQRYAALAFGVTTNFDPYSAELATYESAETTLAGITVGPRWIGSGNVIYGRAQKGDRTYVPIREYVDAERALVRKRALGGNVIKSYKQPARFQRQMLVKASRAAGIMVDIEGESHYYNNISSILDGHTILEHNLPVATYYDDVVQLMRHGGTATTPTLIVLFGELFGENFLYQTTRAWDDPKVKTFVREVTSYYSPLGPLSEAPAHVRGLTSIHVADELWDIGFRSVSRSIRRLDEAGVTVNAGSHGEIAGLALHWEMRLLAQGGMSNHRILLAATRNGARTLGLESQVGTVEAGKLADLIVLDADPLADIVNTNSVRYTMVSGRLYDAATMNEIGNYDRPRTRFHWELDPASDVDWSSAWTE